MRLRPHMTRMILALGVCLLLCADAKAQVESGEARPQLRLEREVSLEALGDVEADVVRTVYVSPTGEILVHFVGDLRLFVLDDGPELSLRATLSPASEGPAPDLLRISSYTFTWRGNYYLRYRAPLEAGEGLPLTWFACYGPACSDEVAYLPPFQKVASLDPRYIWTTSPVDETRALGEPWPMHRIDVPTIVHVLDAEGQPARFVRGRSLRGVEHVVVFHDVLALDVDPTGELLIAHRLPSRPGALGPLEIVRASDSGLTLARHPLLTDPPFREPVRSFEAGAEGRVLLADGENALWMLSPSGSELLLCEVEGLPADKVQSYYFSRDGRALYAFPHRGPILRQVLRLSEG